MMPAMAMLELCRARGREDGRAGGRANRRRRKRIAAGVEQGNGWLITELLTYHGLYVLHNRCNYRCDRRGAAATVSSSVVGTAAKIRVKLYPAGIMRLFHLRPAISGPRDRNGTRFIPCARAHDANFRVPPRTLTSRIRGLIEISFSSRIPPIDGLRSRALVTFALYEP
jgi:hypothetical protein